jgi:hypothetical protein
VKVRVRRGCVCESMKGDEALCVLCVDVDEGGAVA